LVSVEFRDHLHVFYPFPVHLSRHLPRFSPAICLSKYVCITTIEYKYHPRKTTDHEKRLTTTTDHDMTLNHFDLGGRVRVQLLTCVDMSGWKVSVVLLIANELWDMFAVKRDASVCIFWHTSLWLCAVSSIISHWFTQCDASLQNCINCETWRRAL